MSGIFAVQLSSQDATWFGQLSGLASRSRRRGNDGTCYAYLRNGSFEGPFSGDRLLSPTDSTRAVIGCAYSRPVALAESDNGPFFSSPLGTIAVAYDGVITGYTGSKLVDWLERSNPEKNWGALMAQLDGQFAIVMISRTSSRIFYAVKAKPLFMLYDAAKRGIIVTSSVESVRGMYHAGREASPVEISPYTAGEVTPDALIMEKQSLVRFPGEGSLVLCGGGLDSVVAAYDVRRRFPAERQRLVYFDYGAKAAVQERRAMERIARSLSVRFGDTSTRIYNFPLLKELASSSLTDDGLAISKNPAPGRASEWLPARNTVLISLSIALAESQGYARITTGINQDAATAYPDNDTEWADRVQRLIPFAVGSDRNIRIDSPLGAMSKADIVRHGNVLKIPWEQVDSWSCYNGGEAHCGLCSSCRARRKAFVLAKIDDPTRYAA